MKQSKRRVLAWLLLLAALLAGSLVSGHGGGSESIQTVMRDAVLHDVNRVNFFGKAVNLTVSGSATPRNSLWR